MPSIDERLVFFDLEATGLDPQQHTIIQVAAIAVDSSLAELEQFEVKLRFDPQAVDSKALQKNNYSPEVWQREAVEPSVAAIRFAKFLRRHATVDMLSHEGRAYQVAQLVGHNGEQFDGPFLHAWYRRLEIFCPARYLVLCTKQRALWLFDEDKSLTPPTNFKLGTLCQYFGVTLSRENAHDAFYDVRATAELYRAMKNSGRQSQELAA